MGAKWRDWKQRNLLCGPKIRILSFLLMEKENYLGLILKSDTPTVQTLTVSCKPPFHFNLRWSGQAEEQRKSVCYSRVDFPSVLMLCLEAFSWYTKSLAFSTSRFPFPYRCLWAQLIHTDVLIGSKCYYYQWYFQRVEFKAGISRIFL